MDADVASRGGALRENAHSHPFTFWTQTTTNPGTIFVAGEGVGNAPLATGSDSAGISGGKVPSGGHRICKHEERGRPCRACENLAPDFLKYGYDNTIYHEFCLQMHAFQAALLVTFSSKGPGLIFLLFLRADDFPVFLRRYDLHFSESQ